MTARFFVYFVYFVLRALPLSIDYLAIVRRVQAQRRYERNEKSELYSQTAVSPSGIRDEINEVNELSQGLSDLIRRLGPIPADPDILGEMRGWLADGTLARIGRGRQFQYSRGLWCVDLPQFARRLIARIDAQEEGEFTWQRLQLAYWTVRCWKEQEDRP